MAAKAAAFAAYAQGAAAVAQAGMQAYSVYASERAASKSRDLRRQITALQIQAQKKATAAMRKDIKSLEETFSAVPGTEAATQNIEIPSDARRRAALARTMRATIKSTLAGVTETPRVEQKFLLGA